MTSNSEAYDLDLNNPEDFKKWYNSLVEDGLFPRPSMGDEPFEITPFPEDDDRYPA